MLLWSPFLACLLSAKQLVLILYLVTDVFGTFTFSHASPLVLLEGTGTLSCHTHTLTSAN